MINSLFGASAPSCFSSFAYDPQRTLIEQQSLIGLDFEVCESKTYFESSGTYHPITDKKVLFRSDSKEPLSIVGQEFKVLQPNDVAIFFSTIAEKHGLKIVGAGPLFNGRRFWASCAFPGKSFDISGETVECLLLMTTSIDGTMSTIGKLLCNRQKDNTTLPLSMGTSGNLFKITHKKNLDPAYVDLNFHTIDRLWSDMRKKLESLNSSSMSVDETQLFLERHFHDTHKDVWSQSWGVNKVVNRILDLVKNDTVHNRWKVLCAAMTYLTYGSEKRDLNHQFWDSHLGSLSTKKYEIFRALLSYSNQLSLKV